MQEKYLKIISYEAERLEKLTRGLLTLNELDIQKRMLNIQSFDINSVIKATAASFEGSCTSRNILLELILSGQKLIAQADMEQIPCESDVERGIRYSSGGYKRRRLYIEGERLDRAL